MITELEKKVLGDMVQDQDCLNHGVFELDSSRFFHPTHQRIFSIIKKIHAEHGSVDFVSLSSELKDGKIVAYVSSLCVSSPFFEIFKVHVQKIKDAALIRELKKNVKSVAHFLEQNENDASKCIEFATKSIIDINSKTHDYKIVTSEEVLKDIEKRIESAEPMGGHPTGFKDMDRILGGFRPGQLIIVAARVGVGKSIVALQIARAFSLNKLPLALFTLEMSAEEMYKRILAERSNINLHRINTNELSSEDREILLDSINKVKGSKMITVDALSLSESRIKIIARQLKSQYGIEGIIVDYLQLMTSDEEEKSRQLELGNISRALKAIAKELNIPVIALAQLNRKAAEDVEPEVHMLRESGNLESDADVVVLLHRTQQTPEQMNQFIYPTLFKIGKNRNGACHSFMMNLEGKYCRFVDACRLT